jgi:hypothetical protein
MERGFVSPLALAALTTALGLVAPACASVLGFDDLGPGAAGPQSSGPEAGIDAPSGPQDSGGTGQPDGPDGPADHTAPPPPPDGSAVDAGNPGTRILLFGGNAVGTSPGVLGDTWIWDGSTWTEVVVNPSPPPRFDHAMATANGQTVLFGGVDASQGTNLGDTWTWDGTGWTELTPIGATPSARNSHGMAALGGTVILFGGSGVGADGGSGYLNDTWTWDGAAWNAISTVTAPPPRVNLAMATLGNTVVVFGGQDALGNSLGDTWTWDGQTWTQAPLSNGVTPTARSSGAMATLSGKAYLLGGFNAQQGLPNDTWAWDGTNWTPVSAGGTGSGIPVARETAVATLGATIVLFSGNSGNAVDDTWTFGGGNSWSLVSPANSPPPRVGHAMATAP